MPKLRVLLTFPGNLIKEPVIYRLSHEFEIVTNIRRADVTEEIGWVILELDGAQEEIDRAIAAARSWGVQVDPVLGDVLEG
ncbi:MAG: FeS-binding protein [Chloroflexota bacterium]|nr:MAG: FeS-binding protein [Chloroflexota bacterium]